MVGGSTLIDGRSGELKAAAPIRINLLGPRSADGEVRLRTAKHWGVLASLLLTPAPIERVDLALRFWPDQTDPLTHLRQALADIRRTFGSDSVVADGRRLRLRDRSAFLTDVEEMEALVREAIRTEERSQRRYLFHTACGYAAGTFLEGLSEEADEWLADTRAAVHATVGEAYMGLAEIDEAEGRLSEAYGHALHATRWNPSDGEAAAILLRLGLAMDVRVGALPRQGTSPRRRLESPAPSPVETRALVASLQTLLGGDERLRQAATSLAGFTTSFTAEHARRLCWVLKDDLRVLVHHRLLSESGGRLRMQEAVRRALWREWDELDRSAFEERHARYFAKWTNEYGQHQGWEHPPDPHPASEEKENLAQALNWHLRYGRPFATLQFLEALLQFGLVDIGAIGGDWCAGYVRNDKVAPSFRRRAVRYAGRLSLARSRFAEAIPLLRSALEIRDAGAADDESAEIALDLAIACHHAGDPESERWAREAGNLARRTNDPGTLSQSLRFLGEILANGDRLSEAREAIGSSLGILERLGPSEAALAEILFQLGSVERRLGEASAAPRLRTSLEIRLRLANAHGIADCLRELALIEAREGDTVNAWAKAAHAVDLYRSIGKTASSAAALGDLAEVHVCRGDLERALDGLEEALAIWRAEGHAGWIARVESRIAALLSVAEETG